ncbi:MAG: hypothetical protein JJ863_10400 [Deltaproteobacteria bacterium]|nr:hypothetical protein [Deltaproteobacteria bacterium]
MHSLRPLLQQAVAVVDISASVISRHSGHDSVSDEDLSMAQLESVAFGEPTFDEVREEKPDGHVLPVECGALGLIRVHAAVEELALVEDHAAYSEGGVRHREAANFTVARSM